MQLHPSPFTTTTTVLILRDEHHVTGHVIATVTHTSESLKRAFIAWLENLNSNEKLHFTDIIAEETCASVRRVLNWDVIAEKLAQGSLRYTHLAKLPLTCYKPEFIGKWRFNRRYERLSPETPPPADVDVVIDNMW